MPPSAKATAGKPKTTDAELVLGTEDTSLLDLVDNVLTKGVVINGEIVLGLAGVDLIYAQIAVVLCSADRLVKVLK